jgi:trk system potassium uptake protein TrkH
VTEAARAQRRIPPPRRLLVDVPAALNLVATLLGYLSFAALVPAAVALWYREPPWPFLGAFAIAGAVGWAGAYATRGHGKVGFREGYLVVALTWLAAACFGALPYLLSGDAQLDRPVDALFESMSGFTTTGATILADVEAVDQSVLFWRQLTQWLGGMGIIVLALAVLPRLRVGGRQLLESEMPGPELDFTERIRATARRLWLLYIGLTAAMATILTLFGVVGIDRRMGLFEAVSAAFAALPTGGFMPEGRSFEEFAPASQWVAIVFMTIAGANFVLTYRVLVRRQPSVAWRDEELRLYLALLAAASLVVSAQLWAEGLATGEAAIRHGVFQVVSLMTTTGFASIDFAVWPTLTVMIFVLLMFIGGSAGSTAGSIKVVRHLTLGKSLRRELRQTVHPELVLPVRLNGLTVDERILRAIVAFVLLYVGVFVAGAGLLAIDGAIQGPSIRPIDTVAAAATTLGNVGPALGDIGPMASFEPFSDVSSVIMIVLMWLGRLELIPVLVLLSRRYWRT